MRKLKKIVCVFLCCLMVGCTQTTTDTKKEDTTTLSQSDVSKVAKHPNKYKGRSIEVTGKVISNGVDDYGTYKFYMEVEDQLFMVYIEEEEDLSIKTNDYVQVVGTLDGTYQGKSADGYEMDAIKIKSSKNSIEFKESDQIIEETIKVNQSYSQSDVTLTIQKVVFTNKQTLVYIKIENDSDIDYDMDLDDATLTEDDMVFTCKEANMNVDLLEAESSSEGVLTFDLMEENDFTFTCQGQSDESIDEFMISIKRNKE